MSSEWVDRVSERLGRLEPEPVVAFATLKSDDTGTSTFERFLWQAKLAVRAWLGILAGGSIAVVCEHVEDLSFVEAAGFRFAQLKTRDKGSWSVAKICEEGHALQRLATTYLLTEAAGIAEMSRFEVWLEGPHSEAKETTDFFTNPCLATTETKRKIRKFGLVGAKLDDFLSRLSVHCNQPARQSIDAVIIRLVGAIWPGMTMDQAERLYESLLKAAESAQSATTPPPSILEAMRAAQGDPDDSDLLRPIMSKSLTESLLRALCPPLPDDTNENLLARASEGEATVLELKLARAGASDATIKRALLARAAADVVATEGRASGSITVELEEAFSSRLLAVADALAAIATSNPSSLPRPGEHVFNTLMSRPADSAALDLDGLYKRDPRLIVGHLCSVSDQCRFGWGVS